MNIRHQEIEIEAGNPFKNCQLDRKKYALALTGIVNAYSNGFVLGLNNKWGTGKTTFVKMWKQHLDDEGHKTVYFNAWENDFEDNALTAIMGELKTLTKKTTEKQFTSVLKKAAVLSKHIAPTLVHAIADKYISVEIVKETLENISKGVSDIFENDVNEYAKKKKNIGEFKEQLSKFIADTYDGKPLIFIIDELDRCRPNYAVSILEQIKHFFSVPNIVFVLSIDKVQLGNAVRGVYGSELLDADGYLKRFIDLEYSIPAPEATIYSKYLYKYFEFDEFLSSQNRLKYSELKYDKNDFEGISNILLTRDVSLREQEKILGHSRIALRSFGENMYLFPTVFLFLIYVKVTDEIFYSDISNKKLKISDFQSKFVTVFKNTISEDNEAEILWLEAYLLIFYNYYLHGSSRTNLLYEIDNETRKNKLKIKSVIDKSDNSEKLLNIMQSIERSRDAGRISLDHFLNRINLTEAIVS